MVVSAIASTPQKDVDLHQVLWSRSRLGERQKVGNLHYIDTGAVFGGELTLVQLQ
ncbi:serine/threonine protein phosphatase 1 [Shigella sonnei]|nr:serine/threonine protein phosphatase 1 [Shigella sonnei]